MKPVTAGVILTRRCNLHCKYCAIPDRISEDMQTSDWLTAIDILGSLGIKKINFIGGETTLYKGIREVISHTLSSQINYCSLITNGIKGFDVIRDLINIGLQNVSFSLDTLNIEKSISPIKARAGISIATESGAHYKLAKKCLLAHKNILVEKPLALSTKEAKELSLLASQNNCFLGVCYQKRYNKPIQNVMRAIQDNRFGRIFTVDIQTLWHRDNEYYQADDWRGTWNNDGGALMNQTIHSIDIAQRCISSNPKEVFAMINNFNHKEIEVEDYGTILIKFDNGAIATIKGTVDCFAENYKETLLIIGENGLVEIGGMALDKILTWKFKDTKNYDKDIFLKNSEEDNIYGSGHIELYKSAYNSITNNTNFEINASEALKSLNIVLAAYKSARSHKIVKMQNFSFSSKIMAKVPDMLKTFL